MMRSTLRVAPPKKEKSGPGYTVVYDESGEEFWLLDQDEGDDSDMCNDDDDDNDTCYFDVSYYRNVRENGELVEKPARKFQIFLKDQVPSGWDSKPFFVQFLKKVTSDPEEAYFSGTLDGTFDAILTDDEYEKLCGLDEVAAVEENNDQGSRQF